ncbi:hypothetical protein ACWGPZ_26405 [Priestia megaterium]
MNGRLFRKRLKTDIKNVGKRKAQRVAFITSAGHGIGREIARTLDSRSMKIIVTDLNLDNAAE